MSSACLKLKGLTWGHRRALDPLIAASKCFSGSNPDILVEWNVRSLEDFEHQPIRQAMEGVDFLVFDHPFCGAIEASGVFTPLKESLLSLLGGPLMDSDYIGPSLASYRYRGNLWGLPIDGATNHAVYRNDLLHRLGLNIPKCWDDVLKLGILARREGLWLGMAAKSHHGLLALAALAANSGEPWPEEYGSGGIPGGQGDEPLKALREVLRFCHPDSVDWTSIDLHHQMVERDDIVYCPIVYGYATYGEADQRQRLSFADLPGLIRSDPAGSVLGGAGIGLATHCKHPDPAYGYLRFLNDGETQKDLFTAHHGQPARIEAWNDPVIDKRFNGYFSSVRQSMETAWIRPRYNGYLDFQLRSGDELQWSLA